eukprot:m.175641 g.175641  ORF g.175641 m.175641 type:complete len:78 (+) comp15433_c0_seq3:145-378(+)
MCETLLVSSLFVAATEAVLLGPNSSIIPSIIMILAVQRSPRLTAHMDRLHTTHATKTRHPQQQQCIACVKAVFHSQF